MVHVGQGLRPGRVIPKIIIKMVQTVSLHCMHALDKELVSAARLSKRLGIVWNCLLRHALKRSPETNRKRRVLYPGPGFLSSITWPSLLKKHYYNNGLINQSFFLFHICCLQGTP